MHGLFRFFRRFRALLRRFLGVKAFALHQARVGKVFLDLRKRLRHIVAAGDALVHHDAERHAPVKDDAVLGGRGTSRMLPMVMAMLVVPNSYTW